MRQSENCWALEGQIAEENSKCEWLTSSANGAAGCCGLDAIRNPLLLISMFFWLSNPAHPATSKLLFRLPLRCTLPDNFHCPNLTPKRRCHRVCHLSCHITRGATDMSKGGFALGGQNTPWTFHFCTQVWIQAWRLVSQTTRSIFLRWKLHKSQKKFYNFLQHGTLLLKSLLFLVFLLKLWNSKH